MPSDRRNLAWSVTASRWAWTHGVRGQNIVGAIANEAELDSKHIGQLKLHETYSTVDLPEGICPRKSSSI